MGVLEYVFWLGLMLPPLESFTRPWSGIVMVTIMFWLWYARLPNL